ncbi:hypothetical protein JCM8547_002394 [Rhodosporidiobolus lusitaniae]
MLLSVLNKQQAPAQLGAYSQRALVALLSPSQVLIIRSAFLSCKTFRRPYWVDPNGKATCIRCTTWKDELPSWDAKGERIWGGHSLKVPQARIEQAEEKSEGTFDSRTHRAYRFMVTLEQAYSEPERAGNRRASRKAARAFQNGAELWANAALLSQASAYFERRLKSITSGLPYTPLKEVLTGSLVLVIEEGAFSTWHACLVFLQFGYIDFLSLSSCFSSRSDTRTSYLYEDYEKDPNLPLPVSPKSVYRFASLLEVSDLKRLTLSKYTSRLTFDNVAHELFDDAAIKYFELRKAALGFVRKNWEEVRELDSWKARVEQVGAGAVPGATPS